MPWWDLVSANRTNLDLHSMCRKVYFINQTSLLLYSSQYLGLTTLLMVSLIYPINYGTTMYVSTGEYVKILVRSIPWESLLSSHLYKIDEPDLLRLVTKLQRALPADITNPLPTNFAQSHPEEKIFVIRGVYVRVYDGERELNLIMDKLRRNLYARIDDKE